MSTQRQSCPFHGDDDVLGVRTTEGLFSFTCDRATGHPSAEAYSWLHDPTEGVSSGLTGLAEELGLAVELPAAVAALGEGWFEYGLVEREYARRQPDDFHRMVERWGHTALAKNQYTVSAYIAGVLGRLARLGEIAYHPGRGTGRWDYNSDISFWATTPDISWEHTTTWVEQVGDHTAEAKAADTECKSYVDGGA